MQARLWEDPFTAVAEQVQASGVSDSADGNDGVEPAPEAAEVNVPVPGNSAGGETREYDFGSLPNRISETLVKHDVTVLPVMVQHGWYGEDIEQRRRRRYAVLSALGVEGYQPRNAMRVSYFSVPGSRDSPLAVPEEEAFVPYEWFNPDRTSYFRDVDLDNEPRILVLWVAEGIFDRPLSGLADLLTSLSDELEYEHQQLEHIGRSLLTSHGDEVDYTLVEPVPMLRIKLIGPSSSERLQRMMWEVEVNQGSLREKFDSLEHERGWIKMYAPTATAEAQMLFGASLASQKGVESPLNKGCKLADEQPLDDSPSIAEHFDDVHLGFERTNLGDDKLANAILVREFQRRRIFTHDPRHVVVLLSEWDTFYGRALPESFARILYNQREQYAEVMTRDHPAFKCRCGVCHYSYLRGLDGETPQEKSEGSDADTSGEDKGTLLPDPRALERASGEAQYDYLRRLAQDIQFDVGAASVKAIGVLGTDVHDKLLVLQALHDRFPRAFFFTTDLDARYQHASVYPFTRNLVVASGFDIESKSKGRVLMPPFRDSYQTATFHAVRMALHGEAGSRKSWLKPKLFEIGRDRVYLLNEQEKSLTMAPADKFSALKDWFSRAVDDMREYAPYNESGSEERSKTVRKPPARGVNFALMDATEIMEVNLGRIAWIA